MRHEWIGKRKSLRQTVLIRAQVQFLDNTPARECTIIDISKGGARIAADDLSALPETFDIFVPARNETYYARVTRREETFLCVQFLRSRGDDSKLINDLVRRVQQLEKMAGIESRLAESTAPDLSTLETRFAALETELAAVRGMVEAVADVPAQAPAPDRLPEIEALRETLALLASRLDQAQAAPGVAPEDIAALSVRVDALSNRPEPESALPHLDELRQQMMDLSAAVARGPDADSRTSQLEAELRKEIDGLRADMEQLQKLAATVQAPTVALPQAAPVPDLAEDVANLRKSVQTLILLVSQSLARSRDAA